MTKAARGATAARAPSRRRFRAAPCRAAALLLAVWAVTALTLQPHRPARHLPPRDVQADGQPGVGRTWAGTRPPAVQPMRRASAEALPV